MHAIKQLFFVFLLLSPGFMDASRPDLASLLQPYEKKEVQPMPREEVAADAADAEESTGARKFVKITKKDVLDVLLKAGKSQIGEKGTLEIEIKSGWEVVRVPDDAAWNLSVMERFAPNNRGHWSPSVVLEVNGDVQNRWRLDCRVDLYKMVFMATQRLGRGETPMRPGIRPVICNIYEESSRPVPASEDLDNYEMVRSVSVGQFLTWDDISPRRVVRRGEIVDVVLNKGRLSITMQAMCLQDGLMEETVRLKNPRTRAEFAGVVAEPGVVHVTY